LGRRLEHLISALVPSRLSDAERLIELRRDQNSTPKEAPSLSIVDELTSKRRSEKAWGARRAPSVTPWFGRAADLRVDGYRYGS
jgi:hypothetical protein